MSTMSPLRLLVAVVLYSSCYYEYVSVDAFTVFNKTPAAAAGNHNHGTAVSISRRQQFQFAMTTSTHSRRRTGCRHAAASDSNSRSDAEDPGNEQPGSSSSNNDDNTDSTTEAAATKRRKGAGSDGVGGYDPGESLRSEELNVGDPQIKVIEKERSVTSILKELAAIQQQGPQKYCILGTRHCSYLHQQIIELLAYALVLSGNHVYTSGAGGTHAATIRGALRAERSDLLTVVLPQSTEKQTKESRELLEKVEDVIDMPQNDEMSLDIASRICNSYLLSQTDQLISFAFHESNTVIEATKEAKKLDMLVTMLFLD